MEHWKLNERSVGHGVASVNQLLSAPSASDQSVTSYPWMGARYKLPKESMFNSLTLISRVRMS